MFVNSTDSYSDCWEPFFTLFAKYWPGFDGPIYLNTESCDFSFKGLDIRATHNERATPGRRPTWSEATAYGLGRCEHDTIIYLQDDYFLKAEVRAGELESIVRIFEKEGLAYLSLVDFAHKLPGIAAEFDERFQYIEKADPFRISLQACIMSRRRILPYFRKHENPWHFEIYASKRSRRGNHIFCTVNPELLGSKAGLLIPYDPTGIRERQWVKAVVEELFGRNEIEVDFAKRGWYDHDTIWDDEEPLSIKKLVNIAKSLVWGRELMPEGRWPWQE